MIPKKCKDITGQKFNRLTVLGFSHTNRAAYWKCVCDCGKEVILHGPRLRSGKTSSCGCRKIEVAMASKYRHGMARHPLYMTWCGMMNRCYKEDSISYKNYGMRGIKVCDRWHDFAAFIEDIGPRPKGMTLDRVDNNKGYEPGNVRWATPKQQGHNRKTNRLVTYLGETRPVSYWAEKFGIGKMTLSGRLNRGWDVERALTTPTDQKRIPAHMRTDGSTTLGTKTLTATAGADPITAIQ